MIIRLAEVLPSVRVPTGTLVLILRTHKRIKSFVDNGGFGVVLSILNNLGYSNEWGWPLALSLIFGQQTTRTWNRLRQSMKSGKMQRRVLREGHTATACHFPLPAPAKAFLMMS